MLPSMPCLYVVWTWYVHGVFVHDMIRIQASVYWANSKSGLILLALNFFIAI